MVKKSFLIGAASSFGHCSSRKVRIKEAESRGVTQDLENTSHEEGVGLIYSTREDENSRKSSKPFSLFTVDKGFG